MSITSHVKDMIMKPEIVDVLFFVEHIDREMKSTLEVKKWLEENHSISVRVVPIEFGLFQAWIKFAPKVICLPYCKYEKTIMIRLFKKRYPNLICINLNYEQILGKETEKYKRPVDDFAKKELYHFAWGENYKNYLIKNGVTGANIKVVGKPEIQFLLEMKKNQGDSLRMQIAKTEHLDINKKWIFFPFNDGAAFKDIQEYEKLVKRGWPGIESLLERTKSAKLQLEEIFKWFAVLEKKYSNIEIIYRPHPGVNVTKLSDVLLKNGLANSKCIHVNRSYTIKEWLCCSQVCVSNWSTTMVDSTLIGLDTFIFKPSLLPVSMQSDIWLNEFKPLETVEEFENAINSKNEYGDRTFVEKWWHYIDISAPAVERWGQAIYDYLSDYKENDNQYPFRAFRLGWMYLFRSEFRRIAKHFSLGFLVNKKVTNDYFEIF